MVYILLARDDDVLMTGCDGPSQPEVMTGWYPIVTWEARAVARRSLYRASIAARPSKIWQMTSIIDGNRASREHFGEAYTERD